MTNNLRRAFEARQDVLSNLREIHRALILKDADKAMEGIRKAQRNLGRVAENAALMHCDDEGSRVEA